MYWKKALLTLATVLTLALPAVAFAARTDALWDYIQGGNYTKPNGSANGTDILIYGINHYLNFGTLTGVNGYGIRDNAGTIECKNSGGSWGACGTGGGGSGTVTSVDASVPSFLSISGNPVTTSGTLAITYSGTALPVANGGTGTTTAPVGQIFYGGSNGVHQSVATSTGTCTGNATCNPFTIIGASPVTINVAAGTSASSTLLSDSNTFSGVLNAFSNTIKVASLGGFIGGNSGSLYSFATSTIKTSQLTNDAGFLTSAVTGVTAAFPLASSGGATPNITSFFSTTTNTGMSAGHLYIGSGGIMQSGASSTIFGFIPLNPTRNINTTYPVSGGGDLSADRTIALAATSTWFGIPTPGTILAFLNGQNSYVSTTTLNIGGNAGTATAFASTPTKCLAGNYTLGIDVNGNAQGCTAAGTVTSVTATNPLFSTGGATPVISTIFGTTSTWGLGSGFVGTGATGIAYTAASSSFFGYTPLNPTRALTVNGTAQQISSSAGSQDLSADRTWTLSFPNYIKFPSDFSALNGSTTNATSTNLSVTGSSTLAKLFGANLSSCNGGSNALTWSGGTFGCNTISGTGGTGVGTIATSTLDLINAIPFSSTASGYPARLSYSNDLQWDNTNKILSIATTSDQLSQITVGGAFSLNAGGDGEGINIGASNGLSAASTGGFVDAFAGTGSTSAQGGAIEFDAGSGSQNTSNGTGAGGTVTFNGGASGATGSASGGTIYFLGGTAGGNGTNTGNGGDIHLDPGRIQNAGSGSVGHTIFYKDTNESVGATMDLSSLSGSKTFAFPNLSGTFALGTGNSGSSTYWKADGSLGSVATTTLAGGGPITVSNSPVVMGSSGAVLGCTTASPGVAGCLSNTAFDTFNNKQAALTATWPEILTGATLSFGWATTSQPSSSNLWVSNGSNGFYGVATGTVSAGSSAITVTAGRAAVGGALAIDCATASGSQNGCLSSTDWGTFNGKAGFAWPFTATTFGGLVTSATSSILYPAGLVTGTSTIGALVASSSITNQSVKSALVLNGASGLEGAYGGSNPCTNQVALSLSATGVIGCTSVTNAMLSNSTISGVALGGTLFGLSATNSTLTFSGTYTGTAAQTVGLNLGNANTWSVGQMIIGSSTIGNGTQGNGLTVSGGATTTLNMAILQSLVIGTSTGALSALNANSGNLFLYNTNTAGASPALVMGGNVGGDTDFWLGRQNNNDGVSNDSIQFGAGLVPGTTPVETWNYLGRMGHGSTTPFADFSIHANPNDLSANPILFAIGSSTSNSTTTLFSVSNTGTTTLGRFGTCNTSNALTTDSSGNIVCGAISGGGVSAPNTQVVYGTGASVTSSANVTYDGTTFQVTGSGTNNTFKIIGTSAVSSGMYFQNTNSAGQAVMYVDNDRGSFASYGGLLDGSSANAIGNLFGISRADHVFLFADGPSNNGLTVGTLNATPLSFGTNNTENARFTTAGNFGIGSTTPWALFSLASSTWNTNQPILAIATSSNPFGWLMSIFATSTTLAGINPRSFVLDSGVRVGIGTNQTYDFPGLLDQLTVNGRISTGDWVNENCNGLLNTGSSIVASQVAVCGQWGFRVDTAGSAALPGNVSSMNGITYIRLCPNSLSTGACIAPSAAGQGAGLFYPNASNNFLVFATTTPVFEAVFRRGTTSAVIATSTSYFLGFVNTAPTGSSFEVEPTAGCYVTASSTSGSNWIATCRTSAAAVTLVDTGIASTSNPAGIGQYIRLRIETDGTRARFYMATSSKAFSLVANISTNIPNTTVDMSAAAIIAHTGNNTAGPDLEINRLRLWYNQPALNY